MDIGQGELPDITIAERNSSQWLKMLRASGSSGALSRFQDKFFVKKIRMVYHNF